MEQPIAENVNQREIPRQLACSTSAFWSHTSFDTCAREVPFYVTSWVEPSLVDAFLAVFRGLVACCKRAQAVLYKDANYQIVVVYLYKHVAHASQTSEVSYTSATQNLKASQATYLNKLESSTVHAMFAWAQLNQTA